MGENSAIAWTNHTFNPWIGCQRVSPGCVNCYAEALDARWRPNDSRWGPKASRTRTSKPLWSKPFRVDITGAVKPAGNLLEVVVVNLWPNRLIGDASLPPEQRFGKTNIVYKKDAPLLESGLLGKVMLCAVEE